MCDIRMSKILFWSPLHGQGQTSNLHVTAFIMSLLHQKQVLMMQTQFYGNNLESPLVGHNVDKSKTDDFFQDIGLDAAVTYSRMNRLNKEMLENCCVTFPGMKLLLLPGTEIKNRETFDRDIGKAVTRVIRAADECMDVILIDSNSGEDALSVKLMEIADIIVVNLTQHRYILEKVFSNRELLENKSKLFFLFGDYDDNSSYSINNCRRKYRKYMNNKNSGVIPYCTKYMDAQNESNVSGFMLQGLRLDREGEWDKLYRYILGFFLGSSSIKEETDYFFHRSRLAVEKMLDMLKISIRNERREGSRHEYR